jgi:hypothetical protein
LHLSKFEDQKHLGVANFQHFLDHELPAIDPDFVIVTGDLTDALTEKGRFSQQFEEEWALYKGMLEEKGLFDRKDYWLDLRGNHDCFNVDSTKPAQNFFSRYSVQKEPSYVRHVQMPFGTYSVVAIDGCPQYGPGRPFNFFGSMPTERMDQLEAHLKEAQENNARHTFLIGHYPTVTMQFQRTSSGKPFADLTKQISAYFSGHLHELHMGLGKTIKSLQPTGFADLEVVDLKEHQTYRVVVVDNDIVSFSDHKLGEFPIIHISTPKDAHYLIPNHEPVDLITKSTQLRIFLFSPSLIASVSILVDGKHRFEAGQSAEAPNLWTATWNPSLFADNSEHTIVVKAKDSAGKEQVRKETFVIPPRSVPFCSFGEWLLNHNFPKLLKWSFAILHLSTLAYLLIFFFYAQFGHADIALHKLHQKYFELRQQPRTFSNCVGRVVVVNLFYSVALGREAALVIPNVVLLMYMTVGPWFVGYLVHESQSPGAVFLFGIKQQSSWTVMLDTWFYALIHLVFDVVPSILFLTLYSPEQNLFGAPELLELPSDDDLSDLSSVKSEDSKDEKPPARLPLQDKKPVKYLIIFWWGATIARMIRSELNYGIMSCLLSPCYLWHFIWFTGAIVYYSERSFTLHVGEVVKYRRRM